jgi:DNA recombination protein RmuC
MIEVLLAALVVLLVVMLAQLLMLRRSQGADSPRLEARFDALARELERLERSVREEIGRSREESLAGARMSREEMGAGLKSAGDSLQARVTEMLGLQHGLLVQMRGVVDERLDKIQSDNARRLDEMRSMVEQQLQGTLERRLGESFRHVSERLEQVHRGLGEMQSLAAGVGDLKRVLTNVKARGTFGEVQLGAILEQVLSPDQYASNVKTNPTTDDRVEFAIRLPGGDDGAAVWLPVDAKFPTGDYERLIDAHERADADAAAAAGRQLEVQIKKCAKEMARKYVHAPETTEFAVLFVPTEGLYAEIARRPGLLESLQRESRVMVAGPSTFAALLNALLLGFRTLAIQQRSTEVWKILAGVRREFERFGQALDGVRKRLDQASLGMDGVAQRARALERSLRDVQELPEAAPVATPLLDSFEEV